MPSKTVNVRVCPIRVRDWAFPTRATRADYTRPSRPQRDAHLQLGVLVEAHRHVVPSRSLPSRVLPKYKKTRRWILFTVLTRLLLFASDAVVRCTRRERSVLNAGEPRGLVASRSVSPAPPACVGQEKVSTGPPQETV